MTVALRPIGTIEDGAALGRRRRPWLPSARLPTKVLSVTVRVPALDIIDGPAPCMVGAAEDDIVGQDVVGEGQRAADVQDAAAPLVPHGPAVGDRQAGDGDGEPFVDVEDPVGVVAADGQQARARPLDVQALLDRQLVAGQRDRLAREAGSEDDRVAAPWPA